MDNQTLIQKCLKHDRTAQRLLFERYKGKVMSICMRYAHQPADSEDILQEAFVQVFKKLGQLSQPPALSSWIGKIAVRTAINYYRKNAKYREMVDMKTSIEEQYMMTGEDEQLIEGKFAHDHLLDMIQSLPMGAKLVFNMYVLEGYSHKEVAKELNISELTSRVQLNKARKLLRERLRMYSNKSESGYGQG